MASYKVIQDIEAEDKLIGPFTLRQFIYAFIVAGTGLAAFLLGRVSPVLAIPFIPVIVFFGLLASPFGKDQSSEVWLLAKIRFYLKPRVRIWNQSGMNQLVTVTAPKKEEKHLTDGLSQYEVKSRLHSLADVIDSRGWSTKNVTVNSFTSPVYQMANSSLMADSDRLISMNSLPSEVPSFAVNANDDMLDENNNPRALQLNQMIAASEVSHHQQAVAIAQGRQPSTPPPYPGPIPQQGQVPLPQPQTTWFAGGQGQQSATSVMMPFDPAAQGSSIPPVYTQQPTAAEEAELLQHIHEEEQNTTEWNSHLKTILPPEEQRQRDIELAREAAARRAAEAQDKIASEMTRHSNPAILELAGNDDLDVATIARQAHKNTDSTGDNNEVVVRLH